MYIHSYIPSANDGIIERVEADDPTGQFTPIDIKTHPFTTP